MRISVSRNASRMATTFRRFRACEDGATAIEYALICAVMASGVIAALTLLKDPLVTLFTDIAANMNAE